MNHSLPYSPPRTLDRRVPLKPPIAFAVPRLPMRRREAAIGLAVASTVGTAVAALASGGGWS
jgi:hypothetical protein